MKKQFLLLALVALLASCSKNTQLKVVNNTQDTVIGYLTLGPADSTFVSNVNGIFNISQDGLQAPFVLMPGDSLVYTPELKLSGNISFNSPPLNCATEQFPTGVNLFEFNLNQINESVDISCIGGVNSMLKVDLIGGPEWAATPTFPDVRIFSNDTMYANSGRVGVYPYGCTTCTDTIGKQACQTPAEAPSGGAICNPTRAANKKGGEVRLVFNGYTK